MKSRWRFYFSLMVFAGTLNGCADLPRDQHGSTQRIRESGVLVVGIAREAATPNSLEKRETQLVQALAQRLGVRVEWRPGNAHSLLQKLELLELPVVAATISADSPFAQSVGMSQPYWKDGPGGKDYCLAVAPGENQLLLLVDQVIAAQRDKNGGAS